METTGERQEYSPVVRGIRKCVGTWVHSTFRSLELIRTEGKEFAKKCPMLLRMQAITSGSRERMTRAFRRCVEDGRNIFSTLATFDSSKVMMLGGFFASILIYGPGSPDVTVEGSKTPKELFYFLMRYRFLHSQLK